MNNIDVDNFRMKKDDYGNLIPDNAVMDIIIRENNKLYFEGLAADETYGHEIHRPYQSR